MCCDNKCLFFIKVRIGSLIFGYIAAVITGIEVLACIIVNFGFGTTFIKYGGHDFDVAPLYFVQILLFESTAGFTFSVLLLYGITENKPALVKAYVIYGMIQLVLLLVVVMILLCNKMHITGVLGLLACAIYTLIIYMVYLTHEIMVNESIRRSVVPPNLID